jgi:hypothetical protein
MEAGDGFAIDEYRQAIVLEIARRFNQFATV